MQLRLLENRELSAASAGLALLRGLPDVDARTVAIAGHSFGGSPTILQAAREPGLRALVVFSAAGNSWIDPRSCARASWPRLTTSARLYSSSMPPTTIR